MAARMLYGTITTTWWDNLAQRGLDAPLYDCGIAVDVNSASVAEIWQRFSETIQLALLDFETAIDSPHRGRLVNQLCADGVTAKFVRLLDDMNQRTTTAVRTPAGCTAPFEVVTVVSQRAAAGLFLFNFAFGDIMRTTVDQCPVDIILAPSGRPLTDLEYGDDVVIFAEISMKLQNVNLVWKLTVA
ncbi:hypothetical protein RB195_019185 [Necator americanus]|uniref:Reverse transcriptase domain-containing protein n=1 Tax=Necator americanus TaxID=51031 RepID=A0ABR1CCZ7_NECAM